MQLFSLHCHKKLLLADILFFGVFWKSCGCIWTILEHRQHAGQDFQAQVFLVSQSVCTSLDDADLVVQPFNETKRNFVLGFAVGGDPIPMLIDHLSEFLVGFQALPLQARSPVLEEPPCPTFPLIAPQLPEGLLQHIRCVQSLVRCEQRLQRPATFQRQVLPARQQRVLLTLDELAVPTFKPSVLGLAHLIERLAEVAHNVELVIIAAFSAPCLVAL